MAVVAVMKSKFIMFILRRLMWIQDILHEYTDDERLILDIFSRIGCHIDADILHKNLKIENMLNKRAEYINIINRSHDVKQINKLFYDI